METKVIIKVGVKVTPEQQEKIDAIARYTERQIRTVLFADETSDN